MEQEQILNNKTLSVEEYEKILCSNVSNEMYNAVSDRLKEINTEESRRALLRGLKECPSHSGKISICSSLVDISENIEKNDIPYLINIFLEKSFQLGAVQPEKYNMKFISANTGEESKISWTYPFCGPLDILLSMGEDGIKAICNLYSKHKYDEYVIASILWAVYLGFIWHYLKDCYIEIIDNLVNDIKDNLTPTTIELYEDYLRIKSRKELKKELN